MQVELRIRNADLVNILRGYTDRRLRFALSRFGDRVGRVVVRVSECTGTDQSTVKSCHISAEFRPFGQVAARETDPDLYTAIDRAAGRVGRLFGLRLARGKDEVSRLALSVVRPRGTEREDEIGKQAAAAITAKEPAAKELGAEARRATEG